MSDPPAPMAPAVGGEARPTSAPTRVNDELAWELVRDEWELLLAIGSGPTTAGQAATALGIARVDAVQRRIDRLLARNLVRVAATPTSPAPAPAGFELVPAFYERREGMSSYLRDLVLRRLQSSTEGAAPLSGRALGRLGDASAMESLIKRAELELFPAVVALASRAESPRSERFSVFCALSDMEHAPAPRRGAGPEVAVGAVDPFRSQLLAVLQAAATARSLRPETRSSYLWVAEMRTDPEVALEIGDLFERFVDALDPKATAHPAVAGSGALAFAVLPNRPVARTAVSHPDQSENTR